MEIRRKKTIFICLSILLIIGAVLVLSITIPNHIAELDQCKLPEGCVWNGGRAIGNYAISLMLLIVAGLLLLKYVPMKEKKGKK